MTPDNLVECYKLSTKEWRGSVPNPIKIEKEIRVLEMIYQGMRLREIKRRCSTSKVTIKAIRDRLFQYIGKQKVFSRPSCKCGRSLWHRGICSVWDTYHQPAIEKGHRTQRKMAQKRYADSFFEHNQFSDVISSMSTVIETSPSNVERFASLVQQGIEAWTEAGRILVEMLEENPDSRSIILSQYPDLTEEILARFEAIGRKQIHPKTLLNNSPGMRRLRQLPFSEQERYLTEPVPLLVRTQSGVDSLNVAIKNLTSEQAFQVLTKDGVRSLEAQRAWIEARKPPKKVGASYEVKNGKVIFHEDCEMTAKELAELLSRIS